jgi:RNA polymerase sigma factor (sigma-70 family)
VLSDAELARVAQSGDAVSLGLLLERHQAPLYALALRFLGYNSEAQDAVQDTFLTALRTIDRLREPQAVGWWLRGILRNMCLRRLRERQQENDRVLADAKDEIASDCEKVVLFRWGSRSEYFDKK